MATVAGPLSVAVSDDHGTSFGGPVTWADDTGAAPWPMALPNGTIQVAWFDNTGNITLRLGWGDAHGLQGQVALGAPQGSGDTRAAQRTDFASAARLPDGRVASILVDGNRDEVRVATLGG